MKTSTTRSRQASKRLGTCAVALLLAGEALAHQAVPARSEFDPPAPGTYRLERIMRTPEANIIDTERGRLPLSAYTRGKVTLLSLMYTSCSDENGCPLAFYSVAMIKRNLEKDGTTNGRVRMVSLSFDPEHDTPEVMRSYSKHIEGGHVPWHFLTTTSRRDLAPVLTGFGQDVSRPAQQTASKELMHVLKLFLIDRNGWVREIYTSSYLVPQVVVNDIKTLLLEKSTKPD